MEMKPLLSIRITKKKLFSVLVISALMITLSLCGGWLYEKRALQDISNKYPPPGKMLQIEDRLLHVHLQGEQHEDKPTVIILSGTGSWSQDWVDVQQKLAEHTQVLTYDRPGYGWSEPVDQSTSYGEQTVQDLHSIIESENISGQIILVGHSYGGHYARLYADRYPHQIDGIVLIEARHEDFPGYESAAGLSTAEDQTLNMWLARFGIVRIIGEHFLPDYLPQKTREKTVQVHWSEQFFEAIDQEMAAFQQLENQVRNTKKLRDIPLLVISSAKSIEEAASPSMSLKDVQDLTNIWLHLQKDLTNLSAVSSWIVSEDTGHNIMHEKPAFIVETIIKYMGL
jgi:pimeloyl-ACP methyl ester carboxylesterase